MRLRYQYVLRTYDPSLETILYTDASKLHVGGALCQKVVNKDGTKDLVAVAFYSRSLRGPELSYPIQQQEMLAIVASCAVFERYLLCAQFTVRVCTDHRSLASSQVGLSKIACDRITRWCQKIAVFNIKMQYLPYTHDSIYSEPLTGRLRGKDCRRLAHSSD